MSDNEPSLQVKHLPIPIRVNLVANELLYLFLREQYQVVYDHLKQMGGYAYPVLLTLCTYSMTGRVRRRLMECLLHGLRGDELTTVGHLKAFNDLAIIGHAYGRPTQHSATGNPTDTKPA